MANLTLRHTQQLFWKLITAPEGAGAGLAAMSGAEHSHAASMVRVRGALSATERLEIYADMYFYRLRDCLKEDFPALVTVIGETAFHNLITDYLLAHPPSHFSLRYVGQHLADFVTRHDLIRQWPYLGDVARLEWAIVDIFDASDAAPLTASGLATVPEAEWPNLRFALVPAARLLDVDWPVDEIWRATQRGDPPHEPLATPTHVRVWRQNCEVFHRSVDASEMAALHAIQRGATFAEVCSSIARDDVATAPERVLGWLSRWLEDEILTCPLSPRERT
jgi:putative DNA-binding protein